MADQDLLQVDAPMLLEAKVLEVVEVVNSVEDRKSHLELGQVSVSKVQSVS